MSTTLTNSDATDVQLVTASLAGDQDAFGTIVRRYQGIVTGVIYNRCRGNVARSEELAQYTFVAAWKNLASLEKADCLGSWLCGIARNVVNSALRDDRQRHASTTPLADDSLANAASSDGDPCAQAISREREQLLWQSLEQIPEIYREPMILFYRQQQSAADVAEALGLNEATVRKRLERGRGMLREHVAALIEDFLTGTTPDATFSIAVVAALPAAGSTTTGGGALLGAAATKSAPLAAFWSGPLLGIFAGAYGIVQNFRAAGSVRERRFVVQMGGVILAILGLFIGLQFWISACRASMSGTVFLVITSATWILLALTMSACAFYYSRRHHRIRREDGTRQDGSQGAPWSKPSQVYLGFGLGLVGGMSWMVMLAFYARDWTSLAFLVAASILLFRWSTRTVLRQGPQAARRVMLAVSGSFLCIGAAVVNFRLRDWLAGGAGVPFGFPSGDAVPDFPFFTTNLLLLAIGLAMILPIALTKNFEVPQRGDRDVS